ncbi:MAG: reverse transcriptase/maturase family protein [Bacillota bacterium]|nr:reverse transcriptase/maturase family protein [Bacillota bacterium]
MHTVILQEAASRESWLEFLNYKTEKQYLSRAEEKELRDYIEKKGYLTFLRALEKGEYPFHLPQKRVVNKEGTRKKRIVYSFDGEEGIFLKFVAFHLYKYDKVFCDNCYAFRRGIGAKTAISRLKSQPQTGRKYCLKADISNYFNSIHVELLLPMLSFIKEEDLALYELFEKILMEDRVREGGKVIHEKHGAMAGTPFSPFLANIYLRDVDCFFKDEGVLYFRYSDDILMFADTQKELQNRKEQLYDRLARLGLTVNPDKVNIYKPGEAIEFLGFCYRDGEIDLSENTIRKTKARIKRKSEALRRWQREKKLSGEKAAIGFIRAMNRKFYGGSQMGEQADEFTWNRWFFCNLTVDRGLREIDAYMQKYIRYTVTGRHYKGNYRIKYETMKKWGYRSLVHEYYEWKSAGWQTKKE